MGGTKQRKYERGAAKAFISRNKAIKRLQVPLQDFRTLCIFKGIYPVEPLHKKKVNKGSTAPKTYYNLKDIQFLSHEPLIHKFRETRHWIRKVKKAVEKKNEHREGIIRDNKPVYSLKNVIRERYPTLTDALRDLDDCLNLCFVFGTFPFSRGVHIELIKLCHQRTVEFQHLVMATKALRKVFVSIKGIYFQADVKGETITWCVSHKRGHQNAQEVDYKIMKTFAEYFSVLLGHINIKLYSDSNLLYPPQIENMDEGLDNKFCSVDDKVDEFLTCLSLPIKTTGGVEEEEEDEDPEVDLLNAATTDDPDVVEKSKIEAQAVQKQKILFKGMKFFLGREVPREALTFVIRCCGGQVSWDETVGLGSTFEEEDDSITHQIVDRPTVSGQRLDRTYVQPQWVFDTFNARTLLPVKDYFPGVPCPPHLSPFVEEKEGEYIPEDKVKFLKRIEGIEDEEDEEEDDEDEEEEGNESSDDGAEEQEMSKGKKRTRQSSEQLEESEEAAVKKSKLEAMSVSAGKAEKVDVQKKLQRQNAEERRLGEMMIPKKNKRLYQKIRTKQRKTNTETKRLQEKRDKINAEVKKKKKAAKA